MAAKRNRPNTYDDAKRKIEDSYGAFEGKLKERIKQLKSNKLDRRRFKALLGKRPHPGPLRMADLRARMVFANSVADAVERFAEAEKPRSFYHLTLLADEGVMSDRKPKLSLALLKERAHRTLRKAGLEGVFAVEIQPLINWPQKGEGRTLLAHVHALAWCQKGSEQDTASAIRTIVSEGQGGRSTGWSCAFGAKPVVVKAITAKRGCPSYWAAYILKGLSDAKTRLPRKKGKGRPGQSEFKLRNTTRGFRPELAMRVFELSANLPLTAMVGGVGEGASLLARCKHRLRLWDAERRQKWTAEGKAGVDEYDEAAFWRRTHKRRRAEYKPYFVDGPTISP